MAIGWVSIHRKIFDNPMWLSEKFTKAQAWIDLLLLANHQQGYILVRGIKVDVFRGQVGWSENSLSSRWKWSRTKVKNFLKLLEKEQQIKQQINKISLIITITNYEQYQEKDNKKSNRVYNRSATEEQEKDPNNNGNNEKNEKNVNKYTPEIENFVRTYQEYVLNSFGKLAPKITDSFINKCSKTIDQLIKIDKFTFQEVFDSIQWASNDSFWSTQLKSLANIRANGKNGEKKFVNMFTAYKNKDIKPINKAEQRTQSNIEAARRFLNE